MANPFIETKVLDKEKVEAGKEKRLRPTRYERFAWYAPDEDKLSQEADTEQDEEFLRIPEEEQPVEGEATNPDSLFEKLMDTSKPSQYAYEDARLRSADRLGRAVSPFLDSKVAQGIYQDANARRQLYQQRANEGEQNVLQRRTTMENMWGHYSPAVTQSLTNAGIFMQKAFQAREEADRLMATHKANDTQISEREKNLKAQFENLKAHGYNLNDFDWEGFKANLDTGNVPMVAGLETSKAYQDLINAYYELSSLKKQNDAIAAEADKQYGLEVKSEVLAGAQADFARRAHEHFGFPGADLTGALKDKRLRSGNTPGQATNDYIAGLGGRPQSSAPQAGNNDESFVRSFNFKTATKDDIKRLQGIIGTKQDGIVGPKTRNAYANYLGMGGRSAGASKPVSGAARPSANATVATGTTGTAKPQTDPEVAKLFATAIAKYGKGWVDSNRAHDDADADKAGRKAYENSERAYRAINGTLTKENGPDAIAESFNSYRTGKGMTTNEFFQKLDPRLHSWTTLDLENMLTGVQNQQTGLRKAAWTNNNEALKTVLSWFERLKGMLEDGSSDGAILKEANRFLTVNGKGPGAIEGLSEKEKGGAKDLSRYLDKFDDIDVYTDRNGQRQIVLIPKGYRLKETTDANGRTQVFMERK